MFENVCNQSALFLEFDHPTCMCHSALRFTFSLLWLAAGVVNCIHRPFGQSTLITLLGNGNWTERYQTSKQMWFSSDMPGYQSWEFKEKKRNVLITLVIMTDYFLIPFYFSSSFTLHPFHQQLSLSLSLCVCSPLPLSRQKVIDPQSHLLITESGYSTLDLERLLWVLLKIYSTRLDGIQAFSSWSLEQDMRLEDIGLFCKTH